MEFTRKKAGKYLSLFGAGCLLLSVYLIFKYFFVENIPATINSSDNLLQTCLNFINNWQKISYSLIFLALILVYIFDIPVPLNVAIITAGASVSSGTPNMTLVFLILLGSIVGDVAGYYIGVHIKHSMFRRFFTKITKRLKSKESHNFIEKYGFWSILLSRFLITPLAVPINIMSGIIRYPFYKFLVISIVGVCIWTVQYFLLGYFLGTNWQSVINYIDEWPLIIILVIFGLCGLFEGHRLLNKN